MFRSKGKAILTDAGTVAFELLRLTAASSAAFPPLQAAANGAIHIIELVKGFQSHQAEWTKFGDYVQNAVACVIRTLADAKDSRDDLKDKIEKLHLALDKIAHEITDEQKKSKKRLFFSYLENPDIVKSMRKDLDDVLGLFQLEFMSTVGLDTSKVLKILEDLNIDQHRERIAMSVAALDARMDKLISAKGASWDQTHVCLPNTRTAVLEEIWQWINAISDTGNSGSANTNDTAKIFFLTSVAGAGKTAIAHTIAQRCHREHILASSFFFDRNVVDRSSLVFSTMARDLAGRDVGLRKQIAQAIELDETLPNAPLSRQFQDLILAPCRNHRVPGVAAIVMDGFDEGYDMALLDVLCNEVHKLPGNVRILLTSREGQEFHWRLSQKSHVHSRSIDINEPSNLRDIAVFTQSQLERVAEFKRLVNGWPGPELTRAFTQKAGGLFLWVFTVCEFLRKSTHPDQQLQSLLSSNHLSNPRAEKRMDELYSIILGSCNWDDETFSEGYDLLVGSIMAAKIPLSASALQALHKTHLVLPVPDLLHSVGSLFTGINRIDQPIQPLHLSFRDFVTTRAQLSIPFSRFYINEKEHSARLALLCLVAMNENLRPDIPGLGYLYGPDAGIPEIDKDIVSEAVWYACRFWKAHILDIENPDTYLIDALRTFLSNHFLTWVEITASKGRFQSLGEVRDWIERGEKRNDETRSVIWDEDQARILCAVSLRFQDMGRREEALESIREAVVLHRQLANELPARFNPDLIGSLDNLSNHQTAMGHREEALESVGEAVALCQQLANERPARFELAQSLDVQSVQLAGLGHREEALESNIEAVALFRQLANERPATFHHHLAASLNNLSNRQANLGRLEEALESIIEAVALRRQLANECPARFNPDLARSLNNMSSHQAGLGHRKEALESSREAVALYRQLTKKNEHPATFNPDLATCLKCLANHQEDLGYREEALKSIREAVALHQQLANERPVIFNSHLAGSLNDLSNCLAGLGHREEALESITQAVALYRQLTNEHPATFNPGLAASLGNLSTLQAQIGHQEQALQSIEEAVALFQQLANECPARFNPEFAASLLYRSNRQADLGYQEEALESIKKVVILYRQLANEHPSTFYPDLAQSLTTSSTCLADLGRREEALESITEAVALRRQLANEHPARFNRDLARSLSNLSYYQASLGHREEALESIREVVALYRQLANEHPSTFYPDLAQSLATSSTRLADLGRREEALESIIEAVALRRQLANECPARFNPDLARSLNNLSYHQAGLGHQEEALESIREVVALYQQLANEHPSTFYPDLAQSLATLSILLADLGRREEALESITDAVALYRQLAAAHPALFTSRLSWSLHQLSLRHEDLGHTEEALAARLEADTLP